MLLAQCPWFVAGPLLGLILIALRSAINKPFGAMSGYIELIEGQWRGDISLGISILAGVTIGGLLFGIGSGQWTPTLTYAPADALLPAGSLPRSIVLFVAGTAIGLGARIARGCTSGHGLCGISLGSPASVVSTMTFFAVAVALSFFWASIGLLS